MAPIKILTMGPIGIALAPILLATACVSLSTIRLVGIARHAYGGSTGNRNLKPALILFYALVLTQGALFFLWLAVAVIRSLLAAELSFLYLRYCGSREQLIERYVSSIASTCIEKGVATTINTNLVSFAAQVLLQSQHPEDHTSAVLVLHSLVIVHGRRRSDQASLRQKEKRSVQAVDQICSSEKLVYSLVRMLCSEDHDVQVDVKIKVAEIVAKLACKLRLADIPGATHCISSLLDPRFVKELKDALFVHGLVILGELASDSENCREIYSTMDLVPKIIAPVSNRLHIVFKDDATTVEIVRKSLRVLDKLTSGTSDSSRKLCHELTTKYRTTAENILWILHNSSDEGMGMLAVEILSRLTLDEPRMLQFTVDLQRLLFAPEDIQLRIEGGKALIARGDIQQLVTIMSTDAYSKEYRAVTAEMLAQICARSRADQDRINRLSAVANALSTVLNGIVVTVTTDITELDMSNNPPLINQTIAHLNMSNNPPNQTIAKHVLKEKDMSNRKFLASFLGLAVQIREKLATAQAFADAVTGLPMGNNSFAEKLKRIIEMTNDCKSKDEVCLAIMKSATKLVTWMTEIDTIGPGYYIEYFQQVDIVQKLDAALNAMVHLERYVVITGSADDIEGYVTLQMLVEATKNKLVPQLQ